MVRRATAPHASDAAVGNGVPGGSDGNAGWRATDGVGRDARGDVDTWG